MDDVTALVAEALDGDKQAWEALVDRYSGLVWGIARSHRLSQGDAADVVQTVWLRLVEHLGRITDPRRLPGWLATTTRRECQRLFKSAGRERPSADGTWTERATGGHMPEPEAEVVTAARDAALWTALGDLDEPCRTLLRVLVSDPPPSYEEVAEALGMRMGSIGPTRGRCLEKLRKAIASRGITEDTLRSI